MLAASYGSTYVNLLEQIVPYKYYYIGLSSGPADLEKYDVQGERKLFVDNSLEF